MISALLVIDIQNEFVADTRIQNHTKTFLERVEFLLRGCRNRNMPVLHAHYVTEPDDRGWQQHHHKKKGIKRCERGTHAAAPHPIAKPQKNEPVFSKQTYSAFSSDQFSEFLQKLEVDKIYICGLHSHVCVRQTALDAMERNYQTAIISDAIISYDLLHAQVTRAFLKERGVEYLLADQFLDTFSPPEVPSTNPDQEVHPLACIENIWISYTTQPIEALRNPSCLEQHLGWVPSADTETVSSAVSAARNAQKVWKIVSLDERLARLDCLEKQLHLRTEEILKTMVQEVGKPLTACRTELGFLRESFQVLRESCTQASLEKICEESKDLISLARRCPLGTIAIITPWNNPAFLPISKIAAAIVLGNGVVWKPAIPCPKTSRILQECLLETGLPTGLVNLVYGGAETAHSLIQQPDINAVTVTGSIETGREVAAICGSMLKPIQAELGGNNAALVTEHCDLKKAAKQIIDSAFGYSGQACTATRRVVVMEWIEDEFVDLLKAYANSIKIGDPSEEDTIVGPVISKKHQKRVEQMLAKSDDLVSLFRADLPKKLSEQGCWIAPQIVKAEEETHPCIQQEMFAPVLIVQLARNLQDAVRLCNAVPQGLVTAVYCKDETIFEDITDSLETGVVQINLPSRTVRLRSPFVGWKDSGIGPPEHGVWNLDFYTQWQTINRKQ